MSELAVVSIVVSLAVMLSQVMAVESAELQRLQGEAAAMAAENERAADPRAWDVAAAD
jgi:hypothetical protein